jgi:hypothetical protein
MSTPHRITRALALCLLTWLAACTSKQEIRTARSSAYDTDFAVVFSEVLAVMRQLYPNLDEDPASGTIKTAWHQVQFSSAADDPRSQQQQQTALGASAQDNPFATRPGQAYKRVFIRFDVTVAGGRPWKVRVRGQASEWTPGDALPTELKGAAIPHWLPGRTDGLVVAIHRRLRKHAVAVQEAPAAPTGPAYEVAASEFGGVPEGAAAVMAAIVQAVEVRDLGALRGHVDDAVEWSLGGDGDAVTALAMWQADTEALPALVGVLRGGCAEDAGAVLCPPEAALPAYGGWRARLAPRAGGWKLVSFVRGR